MVDTRPWMKPESDDASLRVEPTPLDVATDRRALCQLDSDFARLDRDIPVFEWRVRPAGFTSLARLIVAQHVSTRSAEAVWCRLTDNVGGVTMASIIRSDPAQLCRLGLTRAKACAITGIAEKMRTDSFNFEALRQMADADAVSYLKRLPGVGAWTAEVYLLACEGRRDIFPAGDIALREAVRLMDASSLRLDVKEISLRSQNWRPFRGMAAHMLWAYYKAQRGRAASKADK